MGQDPSKEESKEPACRLDRYQSACELHRCVKDIQVNPTTGQSPSAQWILSLKPNSTYDDEPIEFCFLKFWQNNNSSFSVRSLNYERWVYAHVIRHLVDQHMCPNFSRYLGQGTGCKFADLKKLAVTGGISEQELLTTIETIAQKQQNADKKLLAHMEDYRMLTTEYVVGETLAEYSDRREFGYWMWEILLQLAIACYALFLSRTTHNDLHAGNIILVKNDYSITFKVEDDVYTINPQFTPKIFDFDQAFTERYKQNPSLQQVFQEGKLKYDNCQLLGRCNEVVQGRDICKIFNIVYMRYQNQKIIRVLSEHDLTNDFARDMDDNVNYYTRDWYDKNIFNLPIIIRNIASNLIPMNPSKNVYTCSRARFELDGRINKGYGEKKLSEQIRDIQDRNTSIKALIALAPAQLEEKKKRLVEQRDKLANKLFECRATNERLQIDIDQHEQQEGEIKRLDDRIYKQRNELQALMKQTEKLHSDNKNMTRLLAGTAALGTVAALKSKRDQRRPPTPLNATRSNEQTPAARKLYSLPVVIGNIYQQCSRVEHCDNEFNCSSVLFEEDGKFKRSNKLNDLTLQKLEQARLERSLSPSQKEVADLEKAVSDDNNDINKARDVHEGLKYKQKALDADKELVMQRLSRLKSTDQQFAQNLEALKKECKDAQLDNMMFKGLLVASTVGVATAAYMKFGKKGTLKGKNK